MEETYSLLLQSIDLNDLYSETDVNGCPTYLESYITLLYNIVSKHPELINVDVNGHKLDYYLINIIKNMINNKYIEYSNDSIEFIKKWANIKESPSDYYYSNGAYNLYGISIIVLRKLLNMALKNGQI